MLSIIIGIISYLSYSSLEQTRYLSKRYIPEKTLPEFKSRVSEKANSPKLFPIFIATYRKHQSDSLYFKIISFNFRWKKYCKKINSQNI